MKITFLNQRLAFCHNLQHNSPRMKLVNSTDISYIINVFHIDISLKTYTKLIFSFEKSKQNQVKFVKKMPLTAEVAAIQVQVICLTFLPPFHHQEFNEKKIVFNRNA